MEAERRFEPWPWAIGLALVAMIGACVGFYAIAAIHPDAEVVEDAYRAGLRFNADVRAARRAEALGLSLSLVTRPAPGGVAVEVVVQDTEGRPRPAEAVVLRRERPAEGGLDADFELAASGDAFAGVVPLPRPGRWRLVATAAVEGERLTRVFSLGGD